MEEQERELVEYFLKRLEHINTWLNSEKLPKIELIWSTIPDKRVGVFSFIIDWIHSLDIAEYLAQHDICIRAGQHCAEPFLISKNLNHTCRVSFALYNTKEEIDVFFDVIVAAIQTFKNL
jgi:cysteine desulfurase/selenocysteine lyase